MSVDQAKRCIDKIINEIYLSEESISIFQNIGKKSSTLNNSKYQNLFGIVQNQALSSVVLSLGKLFEKPSSKYPNFSIPTALAYLRSDFESVSINSASILKLVEYISENEVEQNELIRSHKKVKDIILKRFEDGYPRYPKRDGYPLDSAYVAIKVLRDKRIAHLENHDLQGLGETDWEGVHSLIAYCQTFINIVNYGFFGFSTKAIVQASELNFENKSSGIAISSIIKEVKL